MGPARASDFVPAARSAAISRSFAQSRFELRSVIATIIKYHSIEEWCFIVRCSVSSFDSILFKSMASKMSGRTFLTLEYYQVDFMSLGLSARVILKHMSPTAPADIHASHLKRHLWRNSWLVALVIFVLSWLYQLAAGDDVNWFMFSKALAGTAGVLIAASFALSGFCYYFDFLDTKLGYRKYLGLLGFYSALAYSVSLPILYPERYAYGLSAHLFDAEVILGLIAMVILAGTALISNTTMMQMLGPRRWRQYLRLGYLAMVLFIVRAYLLEHELWFDWMSQPQGLPPGRMVLSLINLGVIGLRVAMWLDKKFMARSAAAFSLHNK